MPMPSKGDADSFISFRPKSGTPGVRGGTFFSGDEEVFVLQLHDSDGGGVDFLPVKVAEGQAWIVIWQRERRRNACLIRFSHTEEGLVVSLGYGEQSASLKAPAQGIIISENLRMRSGLES